LNLHRRPNHGEKVPRAGEKVNTDRRCGNPLPSLCWLSAGSVLLYAIVMERQSGWKRKTREEI